MYPEQDVTMLSVQTNYASLIAQQNYNTNSDLQTKTITAITSGYRINQSGDDAAGLVEANQYRDQVAQLSQGVLNANSALSTLQIADGAMNVGSPADSGHPSGQLARRCWQRCRIPERSD
jgi:flagellin